MIAKEFAYRIGKILRDHGKGFLKPRSGQSSVKETAPGRQGTMRTFSTGAAYLNFTPEADRVRDAYGDAKYARLVALKDAYDPANVFRLNQNIRPSRPATQPVLA